ncbi:ACA5, partial [Symbiodinium sp. KB8]
MSAGIRVRMCTGDNQKTAANIAKQCGILAEGAPIEGHVMLGKAFRALSDEQRLAALPTLDVLARSSPHDKLLLVKGLQTLGETVSVTGDGTNDAPALTAADIGLAMGIVAKEASKIVITDDRFTSIVTAVKWGRSVLVTIIIATTNEGDTSRFPINPVQLLWINLIMDSFAALALATEPPNEALLEQRPVRREDRLMTPYMWRNMIGHSIVQVALLLWLSLDRSGAEVFLLDSDKHFQDQLHYTCVFNAFVWLQITNKINCRKLHNELNVFEGIFESGISLFIILVIIAGQVFIVEVGGDITLTSNLGVEQWFICIALGLISFPVGFLLKFVPIP